MRRKSKLYYSLFLIIPIIMIFMSVVLFYTSYIKTKNYNECDARITDFHIEEDMTYVNKNNRFKIIPTIEYNVNGILYVNESRYYSSGMKKGDSIRILYDKENPNTFIVKDSIYLASFIVGGIGLILLLLSSTFFIIYKRVIVRIFGKLHS